MHLIPVSKGNVNEQALENFPDIKRFCKEGLQFEIKSSSYSSDTFTRSKRIRPAEIFVEQSKIIFKMIGMSDELDYIMREIEDYRSKLFENGEKVKGILQRLSNVSRELNTLKENKNVLVGKHNEMIAKITEKKTMESRLSFKINELETLLNENLTNQGENEKKEAIKANLMDRIELAKKLEAALKEKAGCLTELLQIGLKIAALSKEKLDVEQELRNIDEDMEEIRLVFNAANRVYESARDRAKALLEEVSRFLKLYRPKKMK